MWQKLPRRLLYSRPKAPFLPKSSAHQISPFALALNQVCLHGWLAMPRQPAVGALLFFNGRRESPTTLFRFLGVLDGHAVAVFNYRGLGPSTGAPSETALVADGLRMLDWLAVQSGVPVSATIIVGRSLGSGIAIQVAATRPVAGLILISAFETLSAVIRQRLGRLPAWLLKDQFDSVSHIAGVRCPLLSITGGRDTTIPAERTRRLLAHWQGPLCEWEVAEGRHRGLLRYSSVQGAIAAFLENLAGLAPPP